MSKNKPVKGCRKVCNVSGKILKHISHKHLHMYTYYICMYTYTHVFVPLVELHLQHIQDYVVVAHKRDASLAYFNLRFKQTLAPTSTLVTGMRLLCVHWCHRGTVVIQSSWLPAGNNGLINRTLNNR